MSSKTVKTRIQVRRGTVDPNYVLAEGEIGYDSTKKQTKIGDGVTDFKHLPYFVTKEPVIPVSFSTDSDEIVVATLAALYAGDLAIDDVPYNVGDERNITLSTNETVTVYILGREVDNLASGAGKAKYTLGMKNLLATKYEMNSSNTNSGGWNNSAMRTSTMNTLLSQFPQVWQDLIKTVNKKASAGSQSTNIVTSTDKLWLFAIGELFSKTGIETSVWSIISNNAATYEAEGEQYEYYKNLIGNVTADHNVAVPGLVKKLSNGTGSANSWWLRSPRMDSTIAFHLVNAVGYADDISARYSGGVCLGFCI